MKSQLSWEWASRLQPSQPSEQPVLRAHPGGRPPRGLSPICCRLAGLQQQLFMQPATAAICSACAPLQQGLGRRHPAPGRSGIPAFRPLNVGRPCADTCRAMGGTVLFQDALAERLGVMHPSRDDMQRFLDGHPPQVLLCKTSRSSCCWGGWACELQCSRHAVAPAFLCRPPWQSAVCRVHQAAAPADAPPPYCCVLFCSMQPTAQHLRAGGGPHELVLHGRAQPALFTSCFATLPFMRSTDLPRHPRADGCPQGQRQASVPCVGRLPPCHPPHCRGGCPGLLASLRLCGPAGKPVLLARGEAAACWSSPPSYSWGRLPFLLSARVDVSSRDGPAPLVQFWPADAGHPDRPCVCQHHPVRCEPELGPLPQCGTGIPCTAAVGQPPRGTAAPHSRTVR